MIYVPLPFYVSRKEEKEEEVKHVQLQYQFFSEKLELKSWWLIPMKSAKFYVNFAPQL